MNSKYRFVPRLQTWSNSQPSRKIKGSLSAIALWLSWWTSSSSIALAQTPQKLGVIRSPENSEQWFGIANRLQAVGVEYCVLDLDDLNANANLDPLAAILLANVETLNGIQVSRLQQWLKQGGAIVASGPTGSLSQPQVRTQLRSLLGAYWGFPLTNPTPLDPLRIRHQNWTWDNQPELAQTARGGVVIPSNLNSATVAVWQAEGTPPAVVVSDRATFFGWRWGVDSVANSQFDIAWLRAALSRYPSLAPRTSAQPPNCLADSAIANQPTVSEPPPAPPQPRPTPATESLPPTPVIRPSPPPIVASEPSPGLSAEALILDADADRQFTPLSPDSLALAPAQIQRLNQDLDRLFGRVQSAVLLAEATEQTEMRLSTAIARYLETSDKAAGHPSKPPETLPGLDAARSRLQTFATFIEQQDYRSARSQATHTREQLLSSYPIARRIRQPEIRAIWLDRGTIVKARSKADLAVIFDRLAAAGINLVFFETVNASYPIYPSTVAPEQNPLTQGWDPLQAAVELAHERNMELHAWVWIFAAANQNHNRILNQPRDYLGPVLSRHPDWAISDKAGNLFHAQSKKAFFDPANPEVRQYLLSLLEEIASRYAVDGIQLDYIRYPFQDPRVNQTYGYGTASRSQFRTLTGTDPISIYPRDPLWQQWTEFRIQQINRFVGSASEQLKRNRPDLILSAAVFPLPEAERLARLQQHWEAWIAAKHLDLLVPMTYALDTESFQQLTAPLFTANRLESSTLAIPGIRLLRLPTPLAVDQIQVLRDLPANGYALFASENLGLNLQTILQQTQGSRRVTAPDPLPHRQPFLAARDRYHALRREWIVLLLNHHLSLERDRLEEWGARADTLAMALEQLAADPTTSNLRIAQRNLTSFQQHFETWFVPSEQASPYQIEVWRNRLDAIAQLLRYGENTLGNSR